MEVVFLDKFRKGSALENVEIDLSIAFSQVLRTIEEPLNLVLPDIKNDSSAIFLHSDAFQVVSVLGRYSAAEVGPSLLKCGSLSLDRGVEGHVKSCHLLCASEEGATNEGILVPSRDESKTGLESLVFVATELLAQLLSRLSEELKDFLSDLVDLLEDALCRCADHILRLRGTNDLELDASLILNVLELSLVLLVEEGDASARVSSASGTARTMDVSLGILRRFHLNDQVNVGDVKSS